MTRVKSTGARAERVTDPERAAFGEHQQCGTWTGASGRFASECSWRKTAKEKQQSEVNVCLVMDGGH